MNNRKKTILTIVIAVAAVLVISTATVLGTRALISKVADMLPNKQTEAAAADESGETRTTLQSAEETSEETTLTSNTNSEKQISNTTVSGTSTVMDVSEIVDDVMPCVVAITDNLEVTSSNTYNPYSYFFGGNSNSQQPSTETEVASGSGVIIAENDSELLIVTNNHVVDNEGNYTSYSVSSTGLTVQFCDGTTADATIKGTDEAQDLAVVAVDLSSISSDTMDNIRIAVCGSSDDIKVGAGVIAIGNALGYGQSVTTGIVSAKDREVTIDNYTRSLLQTDAAINPGNSGGGLFNTSGELIGINCAKSTATNVEGMGFAIPISSASSIIEDLMNKETIPEDEMGYLGVNGETVPTTYIERYGYPAGVSITRIMENSPAENAGMQIYDIVTAINGKEVTSMEEMKNEINSYKAGETITITLSRPEGRGFTEMEVQATLVNEKDLQSS